LQQPLLVSLLQLQALLAELASTISTSLMEDDFDVLTCENVPAVEIIKLCKEKGR
jgi:hypothetical protein